MRGRLFGELLSLEVLDQSEGLARPVSARFEMPDFSREAASASSPACVASLEGFDDLGRNSCAAAFSGSNSSNESSECKQPGKSPFCWFCDASFQNC